MKTKASLILFLLGLSFTAQAVNIIYIPPVKEPESFLHKVIRCKWRISCYQTQFGALNITTINSTDLISSLPTSLNNNFSQLNQKMESATTSVASITTLSNLVTVGALSSGSLASGFTIVTVPLGGTASSTLSVNQLLLGNGASGLKVVSGYGTTGQFLTSQGNATAPIWSSATFDTTLPYSLTGLWTFSGSGFLSGTSTIGSLHATSTLLVTGTANLTGDVNIGGTATTTSNGNLEVNKNLIVQKSIRADTLRAVTNCEGCGKNSQIVEAMNSCNGTNGVTCSQQVTCPAGTNAVGGGYSASSTSATSFTITAVLNRKATTSEGWIVVSRSIDAAGGGYSLTAMAVCL